MFPTWPKKNCNLYIKAVTSNLNSKKFGYFSELELELEKIKSQNLNLNSDLQK